MTAYRESLEVARIVISWAPGNVDAKRDAISSLSKLGDARREAGDEVGALEAFEDRVRIARALVTQLPGDARALRDAAIDLEKLGDTKLSIGDEIGARSAFQEILRLAESADSSNGRQAKLERARGLGKLGDMKLKNGEAGSAAVKYQEGLDIARGVLELDRRDIQSATYVVYLLIKTASVSSDPVQPMKEALNVLQGLPPLGLKDPLFAVMNALKEQLANDNQNGQSNQTEGQR
jgi:tetratricopeptide (TPR) repeat protein